MAGIYIHIPFCKQACHYCSFHFSTSTRYKAPLLAALARELKLGQGYLEGDPIDSIYFGGGTPSLLNGAEIKALLDEIYGLFACNEGLEITLEANPDDITQQKLSELCAAGITRLSLGVQTFYDPLLKRINRSHNAEEAHRAVKQAQQKGFELSIDLMYALPGSTLAQWQADLDTAVAIRPHHLSIYCLTIEKNTRFGHQQSAGKLRIPKEAATLAQHKAMLDTLSAAGYLHYETSNFCLPGHHGRHNSNYWRQRSYLGVGPSAHSYDGASRRWNISHNQRYIHAITAGSIPCQREVLAPHQQINEYLMTTLRTMWGCDTVVLKERFAYDIFAKQGNSLQQLITQELLHVGEGKTLLLTPRGKLLAEEVVLKLWLEAGEEVG
jgi:oxygen-independent coproporphyrinogen-3 oxidase